ncbi:MAG: glycosyltransferase family 2 protein [Vicinamibacterales bacterium]
MVQIAQDLIDPQRPSSAARQPTVDVVIVSWRHDRWLRQCLDSLTADAGDRDRLASIVVVDNAASISDTWSTSGTTPVTVIRNTRNEGFARGCNQGSARSSSDAILFLNPDTIVHRGAIANGVDLLFATDDAKVGIVGLRLIDAAGITQRTCGRFPSARAIVCQTLGLSRLSSSSWPGYRMTDWSHDTTRLVDFACGAALLVRRDLFERLGGFDERLFLYLEDVDLARRAADLGWRTRFCPAAVVQHASGWSSGLDRSWRLAQSWRSLVVYACSHFGTGKALLLTAIIVILAPLARVGEAIATGDRVTAIDAGAAWWKLLRLLCEPTPRRPRAAATGAALTPVEAESPRWGSSMPIVPPPDGSAVQ